jgi:peptidoglycan hydrolase-like protein with peptidoglycan-binding domain
MTETEERRGALVFINQPRSGYMRNLLLSSVAILSLTAVVPANAQQPGSNQPAAQQHANQPATSQQQATQEQNLSKDQIRQVQQALDQKGFKAGQPDGMLGPETKNAIKEFQQKQGWNATGELDSQTMSALGMSGNNPQGAGERPSTTGSQSPSNSNSSGSAR